MPTGGAHQSQVNFVSIRTYALHRADTRRAANASQLRINPHMRVAPSRYAARGKRKSTSPQPAYVHCIEPTRDAHQTQVNSESTRTCALHRADRRHTPNASKLRVNPHMRVAPSRHATHTKRKSTPSQPAHACGTEPTRGAHQTQVNPAPNPRTRQMRHQSNRHIAKKVTVFAPFMYFMPHLPQSWLTFMQYASSELTA